jgi:hypothetical protein
MAFCGDGGATFKPLIQLRIKGFFFPEICSVPKSVKSQFCYKVRDKKVADHRELIMS